MNNVIPFSRSHLRWDSNGADAGEIFADTPQPGTSKSFGCVDSAPVAMLGMTHSELEAIETMTRTPKPLEKEEFNTPECCGPYVNQPF